MTPGENQSIKELFSDIKQVPLPADFAISIISLPSACLFGFGNMLAFDIVAVNTLIIYIYLIVGMFMCTWRESNSRLFQYYG